MIEAKDITQVQDGSVLARLGTRVMFLRLRDVDGDWSRAQSIFKCPVQVIPFLRTLTPFMLDLLPLRLPRLNDE